MSVAHPPFNFVNQFWRCVNPACQIQSPISSKALEGKIQGVVGASKGDGDFEFPKNSLGKYQNFIFFLPAKSTTKTKSTIKFDSLEDLEGRKIGIVKDYAYGAEADQLIAKRPELFIKVSGDEPLITLIKMLEEGKISALYECSQVFIYKIKMLKMNYADFRRGMSFDKKAMIYMWHFLKKIRIQKNMPIFLIRV